MSDDHKLGFEFPPAASVSKKKGWTLALFGLGLLSVAFVVGLLPKLAARQAVEARSSGAAVSRPRVELIQATLVGVGRELKLPANIEALEQTVIYARSTGYLKRWLVDLGDQVTEGQLLAEIDAPELDAQIEQARAQAAQADADVVRAEANLVFSRSNLDRYKRLTPAGVSSQQDLDRQQAQSEVDSANVAVAKATVAAQEANVRRLVQLRSFNKVTAPFAGTIIARTAERGSLVSAGASPLFKLAALDTVRAIVEVPQDVAPSVRTGEKATVSLREFPDEVFEGTIARSAGALDEATRTMSVEVRVPNADHRLLTGMYAQVGLSLAIPHRLFEIPVTALYSDAQGTRVAVVDAQQRVQMRSIVIERDLGQSLYIASGLDGTERLIKLANAELGDGSLVEEIKTQAKDAAAAL